MMTSNGIVLCDVNKCTGCGACMNNCPREAIVLKKNQFGFEHPDIDVSKCDICHVCERVCPEINPPKLNSPIKVYAAYATQAGIRESSTSGGIARILSEYVKQSKGEVYAHLFSEDFELRCKKIESGIDLDRCTGSKYVQSSIGSSIREIKEDLCSDKKVLFIGTPCQVAGIENSITKSRDNLITVSFVCGGVPSIDFLRDYLSTISFDKEIDDLKFRNNNEYGLFGIKNSIMKRIVERWKCEYLIGFDERVTQRESCFRCRYSRPERVGDLTIGDFWGIDSLETHARNLGEGVSLCIITSERGYNIIKELQNNKLIWTEEHTLEHAKQGNPRLISSLNRKKEVDTYRELYIQLGLVKAVNILYGRKYRSLRLKRELKKIPYLQRVISMVKAHDCKSI